MRRSLLLWPFLLVFAAFLPIKAEQHAAGPSGTFTDAQIEGRRLFQQKCAVCHVRASSIAGQYAPPLSRRLIAGNEDRIRASIVDGKGTRMPG